MHSMKHVRVGLIGTSWWAEAMYLPALSNHPCGAITAICGRDVAKAQDVAERWKIPVVFDSAEAMLSSGQVDAVIVASSNSSHFPLAMSAIEHGLDVLCEKPLGLDSDQANQLAAAATAAGITSMTPFTYRFMPVNRQLRQCVDDGTIGRPYHMAARYYTGYARDGEYAWRFDQGEAGSGVLGDIGSHWIDLAMYLMGPIVAISAVTSTIVQRQGRPDGAAYEPCEDVAMMTATFASGAIGQLTVSAVCWEGEGFGQTHAVDIHGSGGSAYGLCDWDRVQDVRVIRAGDSGPAQAVERTAEIWRTIRTDTVHNTYRDVFRTTESMTRAWVSAAAHGQQVRPDLADGALVQRVVDAALRSARSGGAVAQVEEMS